MKKNIKRFIFKFLFGLEILVFCISYFCGSSGLYALSQLKKENFKIKNEIKDIKNEILDLEKKINEWNSDFFNAEKVAREQLQMSKKGDQIYLLT